MDDLEVRCDGNDAGVAPNDSVEIVEKFEVNADGQATETLRHDDAVIRGQYIVY